MTAADILSSMSVMDNELDVSSGGADETRALSAASMAQRGFEAIMAGEPDTLGTVGNLAVLATTETTAWPATLLRLDNLYLMNPNDLTKQAWEIDVIQKVGGQAPTYNWPLIFGITGGVGAPRGAYSNRAYFYWAPLPDIAYTVRAYGLYAKAAFTTRSIAFDYPEMACDAIAAVATKLMKLGVDDPIDALDALSAQFYKPVIRALTKPIRQRPQSRQYSRVHTT